MNQYSSGCYIVDNDYNVINVNETAKTLYPQLEIGKKCYQCLMHADSPCEACPLLNNRKGPNVYMDPIRNIKETVDAVDLDIPGHGICHAMIFSTVDADTSFTATLPKDPDNLKNLALIKAMTEDYYDMFTVELSTAAATMYRHDGTTLDLTSAESYGKDYNTSLEHYISTYVCEDDREMMRLKNSLSYIVNALKIQESMTIHYRVILNEQIHYYFRRIARIGEAEDFAYIVVGVACEDDAVSGRHELLKTRQNLNAVETDSVTGLYTKEAFYVHGQEILEAYPDINFDFCILKVQNYDMLLHQYHSLLINPLLARIGDLLKRFYNRTTCISYMGDGTFVSIVASVSNDIRRKSIQDFHNEVLNQSEIRGLSLKWSLYTHIQRDISVEEIYVRTSYALSTIRGSMHQDYIEFDQAMLERMTWENMVEESFEDFLLNGEFKPWFQPKYDAKTGKIVGAEALVRWVRPNGTIIPPNFFIPLLERCGKIQMLDMHIFACVCRLQKELREQGYPVLPISVNLSRVSTFSEDIPKRYLAIARSNGVDPGTVPIEITESAAAKSEVMRNLAVDFMANGFSLHMDDFGAGYSSMASLQTIPFSCVKIDKSLVDFLGTDNGNNMMKHIIAFSKEGRILVVAEGVETKEQYELLKSYGCDIIQGYYFSRPLDQEKFLREVAYKLKGIA